MTAGRTASDIALRLLSIRWRTGEELRRRLRRHGFEGVEIEQVIVRLESDGWLNDARFAEAYSRSKLRKGIGLRRIRRELQELGVDDAVSAAGIGAAAADEDEAGRLSDLCQKRIDRVIARDGIAALDGDAARKKIVSFLLNRGYELSAVLTTLDQAMRRVRAARAGSIDADE